MAKSTKGGKGRTDKGNSVGAIAAGIAGITAAAVGAYYLYGSKDAKKHRAQVRGWMLKAKGEVIEQLEGVQDVTESAYMAAVDAVAKRYDQLKRIDPVELEAFIYEMKDHWDGIRSTMNKSSKRPTVKKVSSRRPTSREYSGKPGSKKAGAAKSATKTSAKKKGPGRPPKK